MDERLKPYVRTCIGEDRSLLTEAESKELLAAFDLPVVDEVATTSVDEAVSRANELGYPVVLKGVSPDVPHKSDAGLIQLGLDNPNAVRKGYEAIEVAFSDEAPDARMDGVLVQPMVEGQEAIVGMTNDGQFGPVVLFGLGGVFVEIFDDVVLRLPPIDRSTAEEMLSRLRSNPLLTGARGETPRDTDAVIELLMKFSTFCEAIGPLLAEVDINPLMIFENGQGVCAVDAVVRFSDEALTEHARAQ